MTVTNEQFSQFQEMGFVMVEAVLNSEELSRIDNELESVAPDVVGDRRFLDREWCRMVAHVVRHRLLKRRLIYRASRPVLCTYFNKHPDNNWRVSLHRDMHLPLATRIESPQWQNWSDKQGIPHAQASRDLLEKMIAVRVNLDATEADGGALCVVPGSQRCMDNSSDTVECFGARGSALVMSPLLLHCSKKSATDAPRRVLHFLYGPDGLPGGAAWYYEI